MSAEPFEETAFDEHGSYVRRWICPRPAVGESYRVIKQEWNEDYTVVTVIEIRPEGN